MKLTDVVIAAYFVLRAEPRRIAYTEYMKQDRFAACTG
jgi:hypothetical protein